MPASVGHDSTRRRHPANVSGYTPGYSPRRSATCGAAQPAACLPARRRLSGNQATCSRARHHHTRRGAASPTTGTVSRQSSASSRRRRIRNHYPQAATSRTFPQAPPIFAEEQVYPFSPQPVARLPAPCPFYADRQLRGDQPHLAFCAWTNCQCRRSARPGAALQTNSAAASKKRTAVQSPSVERADAGNKQLGPGHAGPDPARGMLAGYHTRLYDANSSSVRADRLALPTRHARPSHLRSRWSGKRALRDCTAQNNASTSRVPEGYRAATVTAQSPGAPEIDHHYACRGGSRRPERLIAPRVPRANGVFVSSPRREPAQATLPVCER